MKYNEKVERFSPKLGRKNLANGLSCPPFVYMEDSDNGMWVHYAKYCKNITKQKYKRCLAMAMWCKSKSEIYNEFAADAAEYMSSYEARFRSKAVHYEKWHKRWLKIAEQFKEAK